MNNKEQQLKELGVSIHVAATGAGAGIQNELWAIPGSSAYLSGSSFPYAPEEQEEFLGFMPVHFCSEEAAIDLASAAYMKAYRFGGKKPVGVGITASVASEKEHRGDHRAFICVMTDNKVRLLHLSIEKGVGSRKRHQDGQLCDDSAYWMIMETLGIVPADISAKATDAAELAKSRFWERPYFTAEGKRHKEFININHALMPGAFNPPHEGHLCLADQYEQTYGSRVVFAMCTNPPHKGELTVQECLQRAQLLRGRDRLFTRDDPYYIDKARRYPYTPMLIGTDALLRMFDPKWGLDPEETLTEFERLGTKFYVGGRVIDGKFVSADDALNTLPMFTPNTPDGTKGEDGFRARWSNIVVEIDGRWDISSTELRNKLTQDSK